MSGKQLHRQRSVPQRTCVICREKRDKRSLVRIVYGTAGLQIDPTGKMDGRGAYLCDQQSCWKRALEGQVLGKALRMTLTDEDLQRLQQARPQT